MLPLTMWPELDKRSGVYCILHIPSVRRYIGSAVSLRSRVKYHLWSLRRGEHHSRKLQRFFSKHGEAEFAVCVLEYVENKTDLIDREQASIDEFCPWFNTRPKAGSQLGLKHREESKLKMSEAAKKRKRGPCSEETKRRIAEAKRGKTFKMSKEALKKRSLKPSPLKGKSRPYMAWYSHSEETRKKIAQKRLGKKLSTETRRKISEVQKGKKQSDETRRKKSLARKGEFHSKEWTRNAIAARMRNRELRKKHHQLILF